jgi:hypothetical protein
LQKYFNKPLIIKLFITNFFSINTKNINNSKILKIFLKSCQLQIQTPCQSCPCRNGATCIDVNIPLLSNNNPTSSLISNSSYQCFCSRGYIGINCEQFSNPCSSNPCLNQGLCQAILPNLFECKCLQGYTGFYCQFINNSCQQQSCAVNFTNQILNIYSDSDTASFESYRSCILNTWYSLNPSSN